MKKERGYIIGDRILDPHLGYGVTRDEYIRRHGDGDTGGRRATKDIHRRMDEAATFHNGVLTGKSKIGRDAGFGLIADRNFAPSSFVTEFAGYRVSHEKALEMRTKRLNGYRHLGPLFPQHECLVGIQEPKIGDGGASLANDASKEAFAFFERYRAHEHAVIKKKNPHAYILPSPLTPPSGGNNGRFLVIWDERYARYRLFIQAVREIKKGEEIYVSYGRTYWRAAHQSLDEDIEAKTHTHIEGNRKKTDKKATS
eukprot:GDKI01049396.1.p1 GENE.GDKI01049396.1~~GDKI01049396.1.p1  ORF type:complete len:272 (-),score=50.99 GDKI01049396.1:352-1116(-)